MFREIIQIFSNPDDLILDPFAGGGTTAYAAEAECRRHISFELAEKWYRETLDHWARGKSAKPLKFPTTPVEKAVAARKKFLKRCKNLGVNPDTMELVVKDDTGVVDHDTHQEAEQTGDVAGPKLAPAPRREHKHVVRLKGI